MAGTLELIIGNETVFFQELVIFVNEISSCYGLPNYEPDWTLYQNIKQNKLLFYNLNESLGMYVPSFCRRKIHMLQTIAIELKFTPNWTPESDSLFIGQPIDIDLVQQVFGTQQSHFVLFNFNYASKGHYIPIRFQDVKVPNSLLSYFGSSFNLRDDLKYIANKLKFELGDYTDNFDILFEEKYNELSQKKDLLMYEKLILLRL